MRRTLAVATILIALLSSAFGQKDAHLRVANVVIRIQRADYEGNRAELKTLYERLAPFENEKTISSRVRYWRGFALWRRALNGFNDSVDPKELEQDLVEAAHEFKSAAAADPDFVDAKVAQGSCFSNLIFLNRGNPSRLPELISQAQQALKEAEGQDPDNPRLAWVRGSNVWYAGQQSEQNQRKAIEIYQRGLAAIRQQRISSDPLQPSWGEPELLMNLAWSDLHRKNPDLKAAQTYAQSALSMVPYWHYVRDILMPQIQNAIEANESPKAAQSGDPSDFLPFRLSPLCSKSHSFRNLCVIA